jgi:hypothetical protein
MPELVVQLTLRCSSIRSADSDAVGDQFSGHVDARRGAGDAREAARGR